MNIYEEILSVLEKDEYLRSADNIHFIERKLKDLTEEQMDIIIDKLITIYSSNSFHYQVGGSSGTFHSIIYALGDKQYFVKALELTKKLPVILKNRPNEFRSSYAFEKSAPSMSDDNYEEKMQQHILKFCQGTMDYCLTGLSNRQFYYQKPLNTNLFHDILNAMSDKTKLKFLADIKEDFFELYKEKGITIDMLEIPEEIINQLDDIESLTEEHFNEMSNILKNLN